MKLQEALKVDAVCIALSGAEPRTGKIAPMVTKGSLTHYKYWAFGIDSMFCGSLAVRVEPILASQLAEEDDWLPYKSSEQCSIY
jgi:hypothetical protein